MLATRMRMAAAGVTGTPAAGWWVVAGKTCVAAYQPIGAASLAASYTNLANPGTYDAAPGVAPTWASGTGWTFNAALVQRLLTGIVPADGWTAICKFSDATANGNAIFGSYTGNTTRFIIQIGATNITYQQGFYTTVTPTLTAGVLAISGQRGYRNGTAEGSAISAWSGTATSQIAIGGYATSGTNVVANLTGKIQAVAIYSDTLSGAEVATLSAAMAALT